MRGGKKNSDCKKRLKRRKWKSENAKKRQKLPNKNGLKLKFNNKKKRSEPCKSRKSNNAKKQLSERKKKSRADPVE